VYWATAGPRRHAPSRFDGDPAAILHLHQRHGTPEAAASFIGSEVPLFGNIIKATGLKAE